MIKLEKILEEITCYSCDRKVNEEYSVEVEGDDLCFRCYNFYYFTCTNCKGVFWYDNSIEAEGENLFCDTCSLW